MLCFYVKLANFNELEGLSDVLNSGKFISMSIEVICLPGIIANPSILASSPFSGPAKDHMLLVIQLIK